MDSPSSGLFGAKVLDLGRGLDLTRFVKASGESEVAIQGSRYLFLVRHFRDDCAASRVDDEVASALADEAVIANDVERLVRGFGVLHHIRAYDAARGAVASRVRLRMRGHASHAHAPFIDAVADPHRADKRDREHRQTIGGPNAPDHDHVLLHPFAIEVLRNDRADFRVPEKCGGAARHHVEVVVEQDLLVRHADALGDALDFLHDARAALFHVRDYRWVELVRRLAAARAVVFVALANIVRVRSAVLSADLLRRSAQLDEPHRALLLTGSFCGTGGKLSRYTRSRRPCVSRGPRADEPPRPAKPRAWPRCPAPAHGPAGRFGSAEPTSVWHTARQTQTYVSP